MRTNLFLLFSILSFTFGIAQKKERLLMVGNSFTFYYNLPMTIEQLAKDKGLCWEVHQSTASGATLKQHWKGEKQLKTKRRIKQRKYDHIVFQEHSTYPLNAIDTTQKYLNKLVEKSSRKTLKYLYATWGYPGMFKGENPQVWSLKIEKALASVQPPNTKILPVGRAFDLFHTRYPDQTLFTSDDKHPNPIGSYLAACVIFSKVSGLSSKGLVRRVAKKGKKGKDVFYFIVEKKTAEQCQGIADEIVFGN